MALFLVTSPTTAHFLPFDPFNSKLDRSLRDVKAEKSVHMTNISKTVRILKIIKIDNADKIVKTATTELHATVWTSYKSRTFHFLK